MNGERPPRTLHELSECLDALVRQVIYTYGHFLNLARQREGFSYSRDANGALSLPSCSP